MTRFVVLIAAAAALAACHHGPKEEQAAAPPAPVVVGGYGLANAEDADTKAAEKLAVDEIYKREPQRGLVENVKRDVQVVAGLNYRFDIKMTGVNRYRIVVFKPLQGAMSVTSFEKLPAAN